MIARYAHTVDDRDIDGIVGCFAPDGRIDFEGGQTSGEGHDGIRSRVRGGLRRHRRSPAPATSTHLMANTLITVDGDRPTPRPRPSPSWPAGHAAP